jgi:hypothetical protein
VRNQSRSILQHHQEYFRLRGELDQRTVLTACGGFQAIRNIAIVPASRGHKEMAHGASSLSRPAVAHLARFTLAIAAIS